MSDPLEDRARAIVEPTWLTPDEKLMLRQAILTFAREVEAETLERAANLSLGFNAHHPQELPNAIRSLKAPSQGTKP